MFNCSDLIQEKSSTLTGELHKTTSQKARNDKKVVMHKHVTFITYTPFTPKALPNKPLNVAAKKGRNTILIYIISKYFKHFTN